MAKIHGLIYVLTGLFVSIMSLKLNYPKLIFFFYIGLIFIFVGCIKLILSFLRKKKNETKNAQLDLHRQDNDIPQHQKHFKYCPKCRNAVKINDIFCSRCGNRL